MSATVDKLADFHTTLIRSLVRGGDVRGTVSRKLPLIVRLLRRQRGAETGDKSAMGKGEERRVGVVCWVVSWRFESDQPLRFISGLETNFNPSVSYSAHSQHNVSPVFLQHSRTIGIDT